MLRRVQILPTSLREEMLRYVPRTDDPEIRARRAAALVVTGGVKRLGVHQAGEGALEAERLVSLVLRHGLFGCSEGVGGVPLRELEPWPHLEELIRAVAEGKGAALPEGMAPRAS